MPITANVAALAGVGMRTAGEHLEAVAAGRCEPADLVVGADGPVASDPAMDAVLGVRASDVVASCQLSGKAGQSAQVVAQAGPAVVRVAFLGAGDYSARALRRPGAELGRMLRPGETAVSDAVAGRSDDQVRALTEGILLGSYRYSEKSAASQEDAKTAECGCSERPRPRPRSARLPRSPRQWRWSGISPTLRRSARARSGWLTRPSELPPRPG